MGNLSSAIRAGNLFSSRRRRGELSGTVTYAFCAGPRAKTRVVTWRSVVVTKVVFVPLLLGAGVAGGGVRSGESVESMSRISSS